MNINQFEEKNYIIGSLIRLNNELLTTDLLIKTLKHIEKNNINLKKLTDQEITDIYYSMCYDLEGV